MPEAITQEGKLVKLKFIAYSDISFAEDKKGAEYEVMFNPNNIAVKLQVERDGNQADGATSAEMKFKRIKPQDYSFEFIIDGTGEAKKEVPAEVEKFLKIIYFLEGDTHHPNYVKILYGAVLLKCVLKSVDISYTLFSPNAKPLRAKINSTFTSCIDQALSEMINNKSSPDLTHSRKTKRGDKLISMANKIYKKNSYYLAVARANNLDSFRNLEEGTKVFFPPIVKTE
jgi:nucleoid-associated protein YgaU